MLTYPGSGMQAELLFSGHIFERPYKQRQSLRLFEIVNLLSETEDFVRGVFGSLIKEEQVVQSASERTSICLASTEIGFRSIVSPYAGNPRPRPQPRLFLPLSSRKHTSAHRIARPNHESGDETSHSRQQGLQ